MFVNIVISISLNGEMLFFKRGRKGCKGREGKLVILMGPRRRGRTLLAATTATPGRWRHEVRKGTAVDWVTTLGLVVGTTLGLELLAALGDTALPLVPATLVPDQVNLTLLTLGVPDGARDQSRGHITASVSQKALLEDHAEVLAIRQSARTRARLTVTLLQEALEKGDQRDPATGVVSLLARLVASEVRLMSWMREHLDLLTVRQGLRLLGWRLGDGDDRARLALLGELGKVFLRWQVIHGAVHKLLHETSQACLVLGTLSSMLIVGGLTRLSGGRAKCGSVEGT